MSIVLAVFDAGRLHAQRGEIVTEKADIASNIEQSQTCDIPNIRAHVVTQKLCAVNAQTFVMSGRNDRGVSRVISDRGQFFQLPAVPEQRLIVLTTSQNRPQSTCPDAEEKPESILCLRIDRKSQQPSLQVRDVPRLGEADNAIEGIKLTMLHDEGN